MGMQTIKEKDEEIRSLNAQILKNEKALSANLTQQNILDCIEQNYRPPNGKKQSTKPLNLRGMESQIKEMHSRIDLCARINVDKLESVKEIISNKQLLSDTEMQTQFCKLKTGMHAITKKMDKMMMESTMNAMGAQSPFSKEELMNSLKSMLIQIDLERASNGNCDDEDVESIHSSVDKEECSVIQQIDDEMKKTFEHDLFENIRRCKQEIIAHIDDKWEQQKEKSQSPRSTQRQLLENEKDETEKYI